MNKLKILYVGHRYHTNQIPIMKGWNEKGITPFFLAQYEGRGECHDNVSFLSMEMSSFIKKKFTRIERKYDPTYAESWKIKHFIPDFLATYRQLKKINPDVVIIREFKKGNAIICLVCKLLGIKKVIMYVQTPLYGAKTVKNKMRDYFRKLIFPSVTFTPVFRKGADRTSTELGSAYDSPGYFVPLVYDAPKSIRDTYLDNGVIRILDVGKYREYKNHFFLVDAISLLKNPKAVHVTIVGQLSNSTERDYYERLKKYVEEKGLSSVIDLLADVSYKEMNDMYQRHDVLVLASRNETAGMVVVEAMANGLCVLSSIHCGLASYLDEYNCGYVFPLNTPMSLTSVIDSLIECHQLVVENGKKSQDVVREKLSFDNYLEQLNNITTNEFLFCIQ